jgi:hypothetical protein
MNKIRNTIKKWISLWPDSWALPLTFIGLYLSYKVLLWIDPTAGQFDIGYIQALLLVAVVIVVFNTLAFLGIEFNWPTLWHYYKDTESRSKDFKEITPWQRLKVLFYVYTLLLASMLVALSVFL